MKFKLPHVIVLAGGITLSAHGQFTPAPTKPIVPPDPKKVSYAAGMELGLQIKRIGADVDVNTINKAIQDVLNGKPTQLRESELRPIFRQEEIAERARQSVKNKAEGQAFLAQNARAEGVTMLPDGLQYRVIQAGTSEVPRASDTVVVNYKGTFIDGAEFDHKDNFEMPVAAVIKGWQEALLQMKAGSKWRIFVPSTLGYGHRAVGAISPDATLIFDIELISIKPPEK